MNGDALIQDVREILRDVQTPIHQGQFWDDREIILALNAAQDVFVNFCLKYEHYNLLDRLFTYIQNTSNPQAIPSDYLMYASGEVLSEEVSKIAQIHIGGDADKYMWAFHDAINIVGSLMYFIVNGAYGYGTLYYYKKPSYIGATSLGDAVRPDFNTVDFDSYIYTDIFVNHASMLLGLKEIQTTRDYKKMKRVMQDLAIKPEHIENYVEHKDVQTIENRNDTTANSGNGQNVAR